VLIVLQSINICAKTVTVKARPSVTRATPLYVFALTNQVLLVAQIDFGDFLHVAHKLHHLAQICTPAPSLTGLTGELEFVFRQVEKSGLRTDAHQHVGHFT